MPIGDSESSLDRDSPGRHSDVSVEGGGAPQLRLLLRLPRLWDVNDQLREHFALRYAPLCPA